MAVNESLKWDLYKILDRYPETDVERLERLLAEGNAGIMFGILNLAPLGEEDARNAVQAAIDEISHSRHITGQRKNLHESIQNALNWINTAEVKIKTLDELGDVEYEGGSADLEKFLDDAGRMLRAALAVMPTDRNGD